MNFDSLRHQVSHFVQEARDPLTMGQLRKICDLAADDKALANALYNMVKAQELTKHDAPEGSGMGVRFTYGPGKVRLGAEPPKNDAGGGRLEGRSEAPQGAARGPLEAQAAPKGCDSAA